MIELHKSKGSCSSQISARAKYHISYSSVYLDGYFVCADVPKTIIIRFCDIYNQLKMLALRNFISLFTTPFSIIWCVFFVVVQQNMYINDKQSSR